MAKVKLPVPPKSAAQRNRVFVPRFGSHLSIAGGVAGAIIRARDLGFQTVQIFVKNQRQWAGPPLKPADIAAWKAQLAQVPFGPTVAHSTYLINLASCDEAIQKKSCDTFADELLRCDQLDIPYLVFHPGACVGQERRVAIGRVASALDAIFERLPDLRVMPLLETTAGQGSTLGSNFAELGEILERIREPDRVGVCIDTCHVFASGYDLRAETGYQNMVREAARTVGLHRVRCWHLNDSRGACGSRIDRHEHIGLGEIGRGGFARVVSDTTWSELPMILETPKDLNEKGEDWDMVNLRALKELVV